MLTEIVSMPVEALVWILSEEDILLLPKEGCWLYPFSTLIGYEHVPKVCHLVLFTLCLILLALEVINFFDTSNHHFFL